jgi:hypothetical protein
MSLDLAQLLDALTSHVRTTTGVEGLTEYEPDAAPGGSGLSVAVFLHAIRPVRGGHGLDKTTLRVEMWARFYFPAGVKSQLKADRVISRAVDAVGTAISGDFTLAGTVMNVDLLGQYGDGVGGTAGYTSIDGAEYRIFTLNIPLILSDMWVQSP